MMRVLGILRHIVSGYFCKLNFTETTDERILSDVELLVSCNFCALLFQLLFCYTNASASGRTFAHICILFFQWPTLACIKRNY
jgi:hypothetical protein